ncbi:senescence-associated carboxylesterase 101-like [Populus nigra]|uniref:senescence-associated carboxylesterase 101-like n=1 Tax=Populus nigra TaxID=3691 RepID=UPI002B269C8C|nr:senescence-associated carboxylesterase 101-like [Populus nigra]
MSQHPLFISGLDLADLVVNSDLLELSCGAIKDLQTEASSDQQDSCSLSLRYKLDKKSKYTLIAFTTSTLSRKELLQQGGDLVSSTTLMEMDLPIFDFLCTERNRSFSIHRGAITLFKAHFKELSQLKTQIHDSKTGELLRTPLIVTGHSIGGSVASLFTLWLLDNIKRNQPPPKLPLCITFGSPFIGNQGLRQAMLECLTWNSCFLHVVGNKDLFPKASISHYDSPTQSAIEEYKAFGTFILCSEKGCACVDDLEVVSRLLEITRRQASCEAQEIDYYVEIVNDLKSKVIIRGNSQPDLSYVQPLKAGIILQLEAIGVEMTTQQQQRKVDNKNLISKLEEREKVLMAERVQTMDPRKRLNQIKIKMAHLEWYHKICKTKGIGYYDCYKNQLGSSDRDVTRLKKFLTNYWKNFVEGVERKPQKEGAFIRGTWLYSGRNYRRMVEPLDIAEYYRDSDKRDYQTHGRSRHYILLEQWQEDDDAEKLKSSPNNKKKQNVAGILTEDSCFWAKVEDALISCKLLKSGTSSAVEKQSAKENLDMFEQYAMNQINNYAVSPEIFLKESSFMKWWKTFQEIIETSHDSPLCDFMKNGRYLQYEKGSTFLQ